MEGFCSLSLTAARLTDSLIRVLRNRAILHCTFQFAVQTYSNAQNRDGTHPIAHTRASRKVEGGEAQLVPLTQQVESAVHTNCGM